MNHELLQIRGRLSAAKSEFDNLDVLVSGGVILMRQLIDPYENNVTNLQVDQALAVMEQLRSNVHRMRELNEQISKLKEALGE